MSNPADERLGLEAEILPNAEFLETQPLYKKQELELPAYMSDLSRPAIQAHCPICNGDRTFNMLNKWGQESLSVSARMEANAPPLVAIGEREPDLTGYVGKAMYECSACHKHIKIFLLKFDDELAWVMKVGEFPGRSTDISRAMEKFLGEQSVHFKKGLLCESHGFGIGAYAYYRRVIDCTIQNLLQDMLSLSQGDEREGLEAKVAEAATRKNATEKLSLVKEQIPAALSPDGINPVKILHSVLSEGIHNKTDEECLESSSQVRAVLTFVIETVQNTRAARASYVKGVRDLNHKPN